MNLRWLRSAPCKIFLTTIIQLPGNRNRKWTTGVEVSSEYYDKDTSNEVLWNLRTALKWWSIESKLDSEESKDKIG